MFTIINTYTFYLLLIFYLSHFCYNPTSLFTEASTFIYLTYFLPIYLSYAYLHIEKSLRTYSTFICIIFCDFYSWWFSLSSLHILDINTLFVMNVSNIFSYSTISLISVYNILFRIEILNFMYSSPFSIICMIGIFRDLLISLSTSSRTEPLQIYSTCYFKCWRNWPWLFLFTQQEHKTLDRPFCALSIYRHHRDILNIVQTPHSFKGLLGNFSK